MPIKSALEIALENTKDVQGDKQALETKKYSDEGRRMVAKLFDDTAFNLKDALKAYDKKQLPWVREGMIQSLLSNLVLPLDEFAVKRNKQVGEFIVAAGTETRKLNMVFGQLDGFFKGYLDERKQLLAALEKQYAPMLRRKEEELSKQMGQRVKINPAQDPEFVKMQNQYLSQLDMKFGDELEKAKEMIKAQFLGA
jgi:hypothetical protein